MLAYKDSLKILDKYINNFNQLEKVAITQCLDRILAEDIKALRSYPQKETAAMDGYAIKFEEQNEALKILGQVNASELSAFKLCKKDCVKTMTGALMSDGSDTLVPVEFVELKDDKIIIKQNVKKGFAVREIAQSYKKGDVLLKKGTKLSYSELALLAELGYFHITVFKKPIIGVLSSGSELKDLGENLENEAQIYSSNHIAIANIAKKLGANSIIFPLVKDEKNSIKNSFNNALKACDILVSTGGVSMGDFDFLKELVKDYEVLIDKVNIKPGRHIKIAKFEDKFILALPGFSLSAITTFILFARHIVNSWLELKKDYTSKAFFKGVYEKKNDFLEVLPCNLHFKEAKIYASLEGKKQGSSAMTTNLLNSKAFILVDKQDLKDGDLVDIIFLP